MNEFDQKAAGWDQNQMHHDRATAIAKDIVKVLPLSKEMTALEYGAGTGLTSFILKDKFKKIIMLDNSDGMLKILNEKIITTGAYNLQALNFDLEKNDWTNEKVNLIMTQMVLHHVADTKSILSKFSRMLNPGGFVAIADLYPEDGSFHGEGFSGHNGFDPEKLGLILHNNGFTEINYHKCFVINKNTSENKIMAFDVFLLTARLL